MPQRPPLAGRNLARAVAGRLTLVAALSALLAAPAPAVTVQLKDGRILSGKIAEVAGVAESATNPKPQAGEVRVTPIRVIDDGLRRVFVHNIQIRALLEANDEPNIRIRIPGQNVADHGGAIGAVGRLLRVTPFDQYGRRIYEMQGAEGALSVVQGITEITPVYTRLRGLTAEPRSYIWDMRLATSSIPRETLSMIIDQAVPESDESGRLQAVRLFVQSQRYREAREELESIVAKFPDRKNLVDEVRQLRQLQARQLLEEVELWRDAGQFELVKRMLSHFPSENVAGATLQQVRELLGEIEDREAQRARILQRLSDAVAGVAEVQIRGAVEPIQQEIATELNEASMSRMTAFMQLSDGGSLSNEQKTALAISGWLLGANQAIDNLPVALSLVEVRRRVLAYLRSEDPGERQQLLTELRETEGASVDRVAELLKLMKPPEPPPAESLVGPRLHELTAPAGEEQVRYLVQLPREYDPLRTYPTIVTLNGLGYKPETQLDYWAGPAAPEAGRHGQAVRHGYITIAVDWLRQGQFRYEYSLREHAAVLAAVRDAQRRFAIDTDRVFLTGHDIGGDAAWDIALAHPDHWAGVIPFVAVGDNYVSRYSDNAKFVPWYFVNGELDGGKMSQNAREFDRYLKPELDTTVVEFLGRGHESYSDEIQRLFDWMGRKRRGPPPEEFEVSTMRPWDSYFWWLEVGGIPPRSIVPPAAWPPDRGVRAATLRARKYNGNQLGVFANVDSVTVWLAPQFIDFSQPITIELNGRRVTRPGVDIKPDLGVLLEDARTRAERRNPFWAKVEAR